MNRFPDFQQFVKPDGKLTEDALRYLEQLQELERQNVELKAALAALTERVEALE